jgi:O-antigen/teichoic acid export membrane protein
MRKRRRTRIMISGRRSRIINDIARVFGLQAAGRGFLAVSMVMTVRWLPKEDFGVYAVAYAFMILSSNLWSGYYDGTTREMSELIGLGRKSEVDGVYWHSFRFQAAVLLALTVVLIAFATPIARIFYASENLNIAVIYGAAAGAMTSWTQSLAIYYQTHLQFHRFAILTNLRHAITTLGLVVFKTAGCCTLQTVLILLVISGAVPFFIGLYGVRRISKPEENAPAKNSPLSILKSRGPVILYFWFIWAGFQAPMMILSHLLKDLKALASFGLIWRIFNFSMLALATAYQVLLPRLSRDNLSVFQKRIFLLWLRWGLIPSALMIPVIWVLSPIFFPLVFGTNYNEAILPFQIMGIAIAINFAGSPLHMLIPQKDYSTLLCLGAFFFSAVVLFCYLLIPKYGVAGAVAALDIAFLSNVAAAVKSWINIKKNRVSRAENIS